MARTSAGKHQTPFDALVTKQWGPCSDRQLAKRSGSARTTFGAWRAGLSVPLYNTVERWAMLLGVPTSEVAEAIAETVRLAREARP